MWYFAPYSICAAGAAAMMLANPMYWALYLSMGPGSAEVSRAKKAAASAEPRQQAAHAEAGYRRAA